MERKIKEILPRWLPRWLRRFRGLPTRFREWPQQRQTLGRKNAWRLGWSAFRYPVGDPDDPPGPLAQMPIFVLQHPFWFRQGTSDVPVIRQIFVRKEYQFLERLKDIHTVIDLGANIGGSAVFFLNLFPDAQVIAMEPAPENVQVLEQNLAPYGQRAKVIQAAIWPSSMNLQLVRGHFRDKLDWSNQVRPAEEQARDTIRGMTVPELFADCQQERIDLVKIDIEGAEKELFNGNTSWLGSVRNLCIEIHDEQCRQAVMNAFASYQCQIETREETTLFTNISAKA
jgi:FkbM family methyltransferase